VPTSLVGAQWAPMAGRFEMDGDAVCFITRFAFLPGTSYSLMVVDSEVGSLVRPARAGPASTRVVAIYPTAERVPLNLLKVYVHFSAPMSEGESSRCVSVRRADTGEALDGVFLPMDPELWDSRRRRLTLLLDPGRIKRGLAPHEEAGYPLIDGVPVTVEFEAGFRDAEGRPLVAGASRRYHVGPAVRVPIDPSGWRLRPPMAGSTEALTVEFERPLDRALLAHCLRVTQGAGVVEGFNSVGQEERSWHFVPSSPWPAGRHVLTVDPRLEDLAGNSVVRVFDRDLTEPAPAPAALSLAFDC
jgi:hypothetical protein